MTNLRDFFQNKTVQNYIEVHSLNTQMLQRQMEEEIQSDYLKAIKNPENYLEKPLYNAGLYLVHGLSLKHGFNNHFDDLKKEIMQKHTEHFMEGVNKWNRKKLTELIKSYNLTS